MDHLDEKDSIDEGVDEEVSFPQLDLGGTEDKDTDLLPLGEPVKVAMEQASSRVEDRIEEFLACNSNFESRAISELFDEVVTVAQEFVNMVSAYSTTVETEENKPYVDFIKTKILQKEAFKKEVDKCRLAAMKTRSDERKLQA